MTSDRAHYQLAIQQSPSNLIVGSIHEDLLKQLNNLVGDKDDVEDEEYNYGDSRLKHASIESKESMKKLVE